MPTFDFQQPTALMLGRFQPFHDGHRALFLESLARVGQVCIMVRDTGGIDASNPFPMADVIARIHIALAEHEGRYVVCPVPNITAIHYGRDVGYTIDKIDLPPEIQAISATAIRADMGL